jgi:hypothetical protein
LLPVNAPLQMVVNDAAYYIGVIVTPVQTALGRAKRR